MSSRLIDVLVRAIADPEISFRAQALAGRLVELDARINLSFVESKLRAAGSAGVAPRSPSLRSAIPADELVALGRSHTAATDEVVSAWATYERTNDSAELERALARACAVCAGFLEAVGETNDAFLAGVGCVSKR